jgi:hypothetical protein
LCDYSVCPNDCVFSNSYIWHNDGIGPYPAFCLKVDSAISGKVLKHNRGVDIFVDVGIVENRHAGGKEDIIPYHNAISRCDDTVHTDMDVIPYSQEAMVGILVFRVNIDTRISLNGDMVTNADKLRPLNDDMRGNGHLFAAFSKRQPIFNISEHSSPLTDVASRELTLYYNRFDKAWQAERGEYKQARSR